MLNYVLFGYCMNSYEFLKFYLISFINHWLYTIYEIHKKEKAL
jgi:hypothetical protein